jgi:hypothetical protein
VAVDLVPGERRLVHVRASYRDLSRLGQQGVGHDWRRKVADAQSLMDAPPVIGVIR